MIAPSDQATTEILLQFHAGLATAAFFLYAALAAAAARPNGSPAEGPEDAGDKAATTKAVAFLAASLAGASVAAYPFAPASAIPWLSGVGLLFAAAAPTIFASGNSGNRGNGKAERLTLAMLAAGPVGHLCLMVRTTEAIPLFHHPLFAEAVCGGLLTLPAFVCFAARTRALGRRFALLGTRRLIDAFAILFAFALFASFVFQTLQTNEDREEARKVLQGKARLAGLAAQTLLAAPDSGDAESTLARISAAVPDAEAAALFRSSDGDLSLLASTNSTGDPALLVRLARILRWNEAEAAGLFPPDWGSRDPMVLVTPMDSAGSGRLLLALAFSAKFWTHMSLHHGLLIATLSGAGVAALLLAFGIGLRGLRQRESSIRRERREARIGERLRLYSTFGHEVRTPLQVVTGYCQLLLSEPRSPSQEAMLKRLEESAHSLMRLVDDFLHERNGDLPAPGPEPRIAHFPGFLKSLLADFRMTHGHLCESIRLEMPETLPPDAPLDGELLKQAITNLLANAARHAGPRPRIRLRARLERNGESHLRIEVEDNGPGLPEPWSEDLFEPFRRGSHSQGPGLGLWVVRSCAAKLGGTVSYRRGPGGGACFFLDLPIGSPDEAATAPPSGERTLLIVEDTASVADLMVRFASKLNWETVVATGPREAREAIARRRFAAALVDLRLDGMEGYSLIGEVARSHPAVRIIATSAESSPKTRSRALEAGAERFLPKPFRAEDLAAALDPCAANAPVAPEKMVPQLDHWRGCGSEALAERSPHFARTAHAAANESFAMGNRRAVRLFAEAEEASLRGDWETAADLWSQAWSAIESN